MSLLFVTVSDLDASQLLCILGLKSQMYRDGFEGIAAAITVFVEKIKKKKKEMEEKDSSCFPTGSRKVLPVHTFTLAIVSHFLL